MMWETILRCSIGYRVVQCSVVIFISSPLQKNDLKVTLADQICSPNLKNVVMNQKLNKNKNIFWAIYVTDNEYVQSIIHCDVKLESSGLCTGVKPISGNCQA